MNREIYEKNMEALKNKFPMWAEKLASVKRKKRNFDVLAENSYFGNTILKVNDNGKILYLNGKYAPDEVGANWIKKNELKDYTPIVIIGISNAVHIKKIIDCAPKTCNILIYEPSFELFRREMEEVDLAFLFKKDIPVGIIVDELNDIEIQDYFDLFISYDNMVLLKTYLSGNYKKLFPEKVEEFVKKLRKHVFDIEVSWNTQVRYTNVTATNLFKNFPYLCEGYGVQELKNILPKDFPVIIVSAGPSLNKNIQDMKLAKGKACIIATDTAMKPLLNAGIIPDLFVIVDGLKPGKLFEHKDISKTAMVTMTQVSVEPMELHKGKKFFYYSGSKMEDEILYELSRAKNKDCTLPNIPTGGSVANTAYSLGINMGSEIIILIGQDLALTGNKTHADGTFQDKMEEIDVKNSDYFEVDAVGGGKVLTRSDFKLYLDWFETRIKEWKNITTIDATEGGALIHGSKVMTLKSAIKKYCKKEFNVKWHIDHSEKLFDGENKEIAVKFIEGIPKKLNEVEKKAKEGLRYYEKLESMGKKSNINDNQVLKLYKRIKKINHYMEQDYMAETVIDSLKGMEYSLRPLVYQTQDTMKDEFSYISEQGKAMMYGVAIGAGEIKKIEEETIGAYVKKLQEREKGKEK